MTFPRTSPMPARNTPIAALLLAALALPGAAFAQGSIQLRPAATVAPGTPITLAMVAELSGPDAAAIKDAVIAPAASAGIGTTTIDLARVRAALKDRPGVNWGKLTLSGNTCTIRAEAPAPAAPSISPQTASPLPQPVVLGPVETIRSIIAQRCAEQFGVAVDELRLRLSVNGAGDPSWFDAPIDAGVRSEVVQISAPSGSRMALRVDQYQRDRLVFSKPLMVDVLVRRTIVSPTVSIERGQVIGEDQVTIAEEWLSPTTVFLSDPGQIIGTTPRRKLEAGRPISPADVQAPIVVERGESVWVDVLSGSAVVRAKARAMAQGRDGELVPFQVEGTRKTFTARMSGRGRAVLEIDPSLSESSSFQVSTPPTKSAATNRPAPVRTSPGTRPIPGPIKR